jgi:GNAT superfamily N-acetyltransferase
MENIIIRAAGEKDIPALAMLMTELGYPTTIPEMEQRLARIMEQQDYRTLVAVAGNTVCGAIGFLRIYFWEKNGYYVKVQALVVSKTYRQLGVGALLINACEEWAIVNGAGQVALNSGNKVERQAAHRFYPKMGFVHTSSGYSKIL